MIKVVKICLTEVTNICFKYLYIPNNKVSLSYYIKLTLTDSQKKYQFRYHAYFLAPLTLIFSK